MLIRYEQSLLLVKHVNYSYFLGIMQSSHENSVYVLITVIVISYILWLVCQYLKGTDSMEDSDELIKDTFRSLQKWQKTLKRKIEKERKQKDET